MKVCRRRRVAGASWEEQTPGGCEPQERHLPETWRDGRERSKTAERLKKPASGTEAGKDGTCQQPGQPGALQAIREVVVGQLTAALRASCRRRGLSLPCALKGRKTPGEVLLTERSRAETSGEPCRRSEPQERIARGVASSSRDSERKTGWARRSADAKVVPGARNPIPSLLRCPLTL